MKLTPGNWGSGAAALATALAWKALGLIDGLSSLIVLMIHATALIARSGPECSFPKRVLRPNSGRGPLPV